MVIVIVLFSVVFFPFIFFSIIEPTYILIYNRPIYVHLYFFPKGLSTGDIAILEKEFKFYRNLPTLKRKYFQYRVNSFIENYQFVGREGLEVTHEMKLKIAATAIMLTFGMRKYLLDVFTTIIIYPDIYIAANSDEYHKGEFNPAVGAIVFSWKDFMKGLEYDNDNLNLGLHEFAHALHFDSLKKRGGVSSSAIIYRDMFDKIMEYIADSHNRERLKEVHYFRQYAYTNQYEFIAVTLEYFFETPKLFRQKLPELHEMIGKMINQRRY